VQSGGSSGAPHGVVSSGILPGQLQLLLVQLGCVVEQIV